jgi:hypothetical protein
VWTIPAIISEETSFRAEEPANRWNSRDKIALPLTEVSREILTLSFLKAFNLASYCLRQAENI